MYLIKPCCTETEGWSVFYSISWVRSGPSVKLSEGSVPAEMCPMLHRSCRHSRNQPRIPDTLRRSQVWVQHLPSPTGNLLPVDVACSTHWQCHSRSLWRAASPLLPLSPYSSSACKGAKSLSEIQSSGGTVIKGNSSLAHKLPQQPEESPKTSN